MTEAVLALGSNLGKREANLRQAIDRLEKAGVRLLRASHAWETEPVPPGQPRYLNAVAVTETALAPRELLGVAKAIERDLGRLPGERWGPRPVDIDILFYGEERVTEPDLVIPHERISERVFVLAPLAEVLPGPLPVLHETAAALLARLPGGGAERTTIALGGEGQAPNGG